MYIQQNHYVERSGKIFIVNAPWAFSLVWNAVSPWINEHTRKKIKLLGSDYVGELKKVYI